MTKIQVYIASSLDGFIARESGDIDWLPESSESSYDAFYKSIDTVIMGKTTYDQVLTFGEYPYKDKKSIVFSKTQQNDDENAEFVSDVEKFVKGGFPGAGENIWLVGGGKLIGSFLKLGVVDEIITTLIPIVLGRGIPLFQDTENDTKLELVKTERYGQLVDLHYKISK
ncbi:dihydrofolate reductase family protein [Candidatus Nitrosarchaeum limnium]|uniref:Riboflavin biosynthesis protein RibD C-terminal domain protein n=1 Tax=Candidatus Nitrosarchaeum limnium BG20 TaxID=859192 RepID=S2E4H3_9ARCH|nr:dihydrofolate reductase family protein [Candidatus Nitrosarchaeum limnium]EPA06095.1 riboflavin biosynthesis protein RibD C-terminal domain protein [Candidatus Nitrosarchaeum limnium BG20]